MKSRVLLTRINKLLTKELPPPHMHIKKKLMHSQQTLIKYYHKVNVNLILVRAIYKDINLFGTKNIKLTIIKS